MHFLFILIKNTASLDYTIPVLWKLRQEYKDSKISILYCRNYKEELTKNGSFYSSIAKANGIDEYSHQDMIPASLSIILRALRKFDTIFRKIGIPIFGYWSKKVYQQALDNVKKSDSLKKMKPDLVFLDNTSSAHKIANRYVYDYLLESQCPFILMPHAPHHAQKVAFTPFTEGQSLPENATFWMPFRFDETWQACPNQKDQFHYTGYPGLDDEWLTYLKSNCELPSRQKSNTITCLFVIRRFLDEGEDRSPGDNVFVYSYDEFVSLANCVRQAVDDSQQDIEIIVKPHPSNNINAVKSVLEKSGFKNFSISNESIYYHLNEIDFVISLYSTVIFVPCMVGKPLVFIHSSIVDHISSWDKLKDLYQGLNLYVRSEQEIQDAVIEVVQFLSELNEGPKTEYNNVAHLRKYFPDRSLDVALRSIRQVLNISQTERGNDGH